MPWGRVEPEFKEVMVSQSASGRMHLPLLPGQGRAAGIPLALEREGRGPRHRPNLVLGVFMPLRKALFQGQLRLQSCTSL